MGKQSIIGRLAGILLFCSALSGFMSGLTGRAAELVINEESVWPEVGRGYPKDIAVVGNYAYVVYLDAGLKIFDVGDPAQIKLLGYFAAPDALALRVAGDYAYLASSTELQIVDVADPRKPVLAGRLPVLCQELALEGSTVYLLSPFSELTTVDVSDAHNPKLLSTFKERWGSLDGIAASGKKLYVTISQGLQVLDASDPANLREEFYSKTNGGWRPVIGGSYLYIPKAAGSPRLQILDVSVPNSPKLYGSYGTNGSGSAVAVDGNRAYLDGSEGLEVLDVSDPSAPKLLGTYSVGVSWQLAAVGNTVLVPGQELVAVDVSDPGTPVRKSTYADKGTGYDVVSRGDLAVLADWAALQIINTTDPAHPVRVSSVEKVAVGVIVSGEYAFVAGSDTGLTIVNLSEPTNPRIVGAVDTPGYAINLALGTNHAFVADYTGGLRIIDITNPEHPFEAAAYTNVTQALDVGLIGRYALVVNRGGSALNVNSGLNVIDVAEPTNPKWVGGYIGSGNMSSLALSGNYAYLAESYGGTTVLDVSEPLRPKYVTNYQETIVSLLGDYVLMANRDVLDVSDPRNGRKVGTIPGKVGRSVLVGGKLLSATGATGLTTYTIEPFLRSVARHDGRMAVEWDPFGGAKLQKSSGLESPTWEDVPGSTVTNRMELPMTGSIEFYRVVKQ